MDDYTDLVGGVWLDEQGKPWHVIGLINRPAAVLHRLRTLNEENGSRYRDGPQHPHTEELVVVIDSQIADTFTRLVPDPKRTTRQQQSVLCPAMPITIINSSAFLESGRDANGQLWKRIYNQEAHTVGWGDWERTS